MAAISFEKSPMHLINQHMTSQGLGLLDPNKMPSKFGLFAVNPFVAYVMQSDNNAAAKVVRKMRENDYDLQEELDQVHIPAYGRQKTWAATFPVIIRIILKMPGDRAHKFRCTCANYIVRIFAGDTSLFEDIKKQDAAFKATEAGSAVQVRAVSVLCCPCLCHSTRCT